MFIEKYRKEIIFRKLPDIITVKTRRLDLYKNLKNAISYQSQRHSF